jgi:hypothetical protein
VWRLPAGSQPATRSPLRTDGRLHRAQRDRSPGYYPGAPVSLPTFCNLGHGRRRRNVPRRGGGAKQSLRLRPRFPEVFPPADRPRVAAHLPRQPAPHRRLGQRRKRHWTISSMFCQRSSNDRAPSASG